MQGLQRAWRCTLVVPYVHKPPVHMRRSAPALGTDAKGRAMRQLSMARRDFGIFFMGAPAAPECLASCVMVSACPFTFFSTCKAAWLSPQPCHDVKQTHAPWVPCALVSSPTSGTEGRMARRQDQGAALGPNSLCHAAAHRHDAGRVGRPADDLRVDQHAAAAGL